MASKFLCFKAIRLNGRNDAAFDRNGMRRDLDIGVWIRCLESLSD